MIYEQFLRYYKITDKNDNIKDMPSLIKANVNLVKVIKEFGGKTFNKGIYRVLQSDKIELMNELIERAFPKYKNKIVCFGVDWLGRCFAIEKENNSQILQFDTGSGDVMTIPANIEKFHNDILVNNAKAALASEFYKQWQEINSDPIKLSQCVGLKIPLFLGGSDSVDNLEIIDLEVYIEICGQLMNKVKDLPEGTTIKGVTIK